MPKLYPEKINLFERKDTEDETKDYFLGIDNRLKEVFRGKLGLVPFKEGNTGKSKFFSQIP